MATLTKPYKRQIIRKRHLCWTLTQKSTWLWGNNYLVWWILRPWIKWNINFLEGSETPKGKWCKQLGKNSDYFLSKCWWKIWLTLVTFFLIVIHREVTSHAGVEGINWAGKDIKDRYKFERSIQNSEDYSKTYLIALQVKKTILFSFLL